MVSGHDIAMVLRAACWAMHREADALLQPYGLTVDQFVLMSVLAADKVLTSQELVRRASSDANTVRAMLMSSSSMFCSRERPLHVGLNNSYHSF